MMAPAVVPLSVLFGNAEYSMPQVSPDGKNIAYLKAGPNGVVNIYLKVIGHNEVEAQVTNESSRPIRFFRWACTGLHILYAQDFNGNERFHLHAVDLSTMTITNLTPSETSKILTTFPMTSFFNHINRLTSKYYPNDVVVGINDRVSTLFDIYRINILNGEKTLVATNPGNVDTWIIDDRLVVRAMIQSLPGDEWAKSLSVRDDQNDEWRVIATWGLSDHLDALQLTPDGTGLYVKSTLAHGSNHECFSRTHRLTLISTKDGLEVESVAYHPQGNIDHVEFNPLTGRPDFATVEAKGHSKIIFDQSLQLEIDELSKIAPGSVSIISRSADDQVWTVSLDSDHHSKRFYMYNRVSRAATLIALERPQLENYEFAPMTPVDIKCSDGEKMVGYMTLPLCLPAQNLPMILNVHGGPWVMDVWGFNPVHQWFANRGYVCLSVNYRGSGGYGMRWKDMGNKEWGGRMQQDLTDAVNWAVESGFVDPSRVAIYGRSYGGYAVLAGLAFTPDVFACGVDIVGPSNIESLLEAMPPDWEHMRKEFAVRIGDVKNPEFNNRISPLFHVASMKRPLLIGQGANDPRVPQSESDQIVRELYQRKHDVTYIVYPDEGHGFHRPPNNIDFCQRTEAFLHNYLHGTVHIEAESNPGHTAIVVDLSTL